MVNIRYGAPCELKPDIYRGPGSAEKPTFTASLDHVVGADKERFTEIVDPIAFAVLRLITSSNSVGCSTGMSCGRSPRNTRATRLAACQ